MGKTSGGVRLTSIEKKMAGGDPYKEGAMLEAKRIESLLTRYGINVKLQTSYTDYGISHYITVQRDGETIKIRFSDHSVQNTSRMSNEIHLSSAKSKLVAGVRRVEKILYPERFKITRKPIEIWENTRYGKQKRIVYKSSYRRLKG